MQTLSKPITQGLRLMSTQEFSTAQFNILEEKKIMDELLEEMKGGILISHEFYETKPQIISELKMNADGTCMFSYNPEGSNINHKWKEQIFIVGNMTKDEPVVLKQQIVDHVLVYTTNIEVDPDHEYTFHFTSDSSSMPFVDKHYPIIYGEYCFL